MWVWVSVSVSVSGSVFAREEERKRGRKWVVGGQDVMGGWEDSWRVKLGLAVAVAVVQQGVGEWSG